MNATLPAIEVDVRVGLNRNFDGTYELTGAATGWVEAERTPNGYALTAYVKKGVDEVTVSIHGPTFLSAANNLVRRIARTIIDEQLWMQ